MKKLKYLLNVFLASALIFACVEEIENNIDFVETIQAPTNVSAMISITQDNTFNKYFNFFMFLYKLIFSNQDFESNQKCQFPLVELGKPHVFLQQNH